MSLKKVKPFPKKPKDCKKHDWQPLPVEVLILTVRTGPPSRDGKKKDDLLASEYSSPFEYCVECGLVKLVGDFVER